MITKNIGMLILALYLILVGINTLFHVGIGAIVMGVLALIAGILILVGKYPRIQFLCSESVWTIREPSRRLKCSVRRTPTNDLEPFRLYNAPTAPEISSTIILSEIKIWIIARTFAQRASSGASVGPNVELCVNATN